MQGEGEVELRRRAVHRIRLDRDAIHRDGREMVLLHDEGDVEPRESAIAGAQGARDPLERHLLMLERVDGRLSCPRDERLE
jgi:hypothetical protein